jgi:hypothetical protein
MKPINMSGPPAVVPRKSRADVSPLQITVSVIIIGEMEMWRCSNNLFQVATCTIFQGNS